jgi:hypothetical protein
LVSGDQEEDETVVNLYPGGWTGQEPQPRKEQPMPKYRVRCLLVADYSAIVDAANEDEVRELAEENCDLLDRQETTRRWENEIESIEKLDDDAKG